MSIRLVTETLTEEFDKSQTISASKQSLIIFNLFQLYKSVDIAQNMDQMYVRFSIIKI